MLKILVMFTGGTIASTLSAGIIDTDNNKPYELIEKYKVIDDSITFETSEPYFILSENLSGEHITKLVKSVKDAATKDYDGIIVTHGTDTLHYSASALDIALGKTNIPVVLVSSNYPLEDNKANGFDNFRGAVEFIKKQIGGVFVSYKNSGEALKIYTPEKMLDYDCYSDALRSIDREISKNHIDLDVNLPKKSRVLRLKVYSGMNYPSLDEYKCVVIDTYHSGTLKTDDGEFCEFVNSAEKLNIPVVLTGVSGGNIYKSAEILIKNKNIVISSYSPIYTYMKCWILSESELSISENL